MSEKVNELISKMKLLWNERSKLQKSLLIASFIVIMLIIAVLIALSFRTNYAPLYSNLSLAEAGQIQEELEGRGITTEVANDGTTILVPEQEVDRLKVELAAEGLPQSGSIDYSFFQEQMGFGMTDNEFTVIERSLMQTELAELIRSISGVQHANVVITLAEDSVWLNAGQEEATAAVVLDLAAGTTLDQNQVKALYHLIARSVPNLPLENIVLSDSNFTNYTYQEEEQSPTGSYQSQREIKQEVEADLEQTIMQLLHAVVGPNNAIVSVTTDIDFTQEQRTEDLVEPVNEEDMEGLAVSAERVTEFYEGTGASEGGVTGTGDEIPNYTGSLPGGDSESERTEERVNYEFNRIHKEIVESPYRIRDLSIQAMINPPEGVQQLPAQQMENITAMLDTIVQTTIPASADGENEPIANRVSISSIPFAETAQAEAPEEAQGLPLWMIIVAGVLGLFIIVLSMVLLKTRKQAVDLAVDEQPERLDHEEFDSVPFQEREERNDQKQMKELNHLANQNPEEFSKLLRTWLSEDS
ncbi:flagellar basal-body MS-ring/collar protein FliF [Shouchella sp. JSM 1781072]|uniref:flagellar basal-body MS-ring/collar protein FliF n=1 Tax=Bacillaceae TaxID=186817 RepID=UPI000C07F39F|nr:MULTISPECIES: flagellar basal-body MS-ring/collar protein FliF [Bacillaceae]UTR04773.1 flagellar M-ring protein FliF [Alkalihalobacillus sp. LMS6]